MADPSARDRAITAITDGTAVSEHHAGTVVDALIARPDVLAALRDGVGTATPVDPRDVETVEHLDALIQWHEHDAPEDEAEVFRHDGYVLTIGDLRRSRAALASRAPGEPRPTVDEMEAHFLDANERMGEALVAIGMALGLPRPRIGATWGAPEILAKIAAGAPEEPSLGLAVESSPLYQEALRIIRESWAALPAAVRDEAAKDGATLAGCIRAIPVAAPPLRGDAPVPAGEFDWFHTGQAPTSGGDR